MKLIFTLGLLILLTSRANAQTELIAHKSHSGRIEDFFPSEMASPDFGAIPSADMIGLFKNDSIQFAKNVLNADEKSGIAAGTKFTNKDSVTVKDSSMVNKKENINSVPVLIQGKKNNEPPTTSESYELVSIIGIIVLVSVLLGLLTKLKIIFFKGRSE